MTDKIRNFWNQFIESIPPTDRPSCYTAWSFGNTPEMNDELAQLTLKGIKCATTSLFAVYEKLPQEKIPCVGEYSIVLDSAKNPVCIIQTTSVVKKKYCEVDEEFARIEGEGDKSLSYWRDVHWKYFSEESALLGLIPSEDMFVICEIYKLIYPVHTDGV